MRLPVLRLGRENLLSEMRRGLEENPVEHQCLMTKTWIPKRSLRTGSRDVEGKPSEGRIPDIKRRPH